MESTHTDATQHVRFVDRVAVDNNERTKRRRLLMAPVRIIAASFSYFC